MQADLCICKLICVRMFTYVRVYKYICVFLSMCAYVCFMYIISCIFYVYYIMCILCILYHMYFMYMCVFMYVFPPVWTYLGTASAEKVVIEHAYSEGQRRSERRKVVDYQETLFIFRWSRQKKEKKRRKKRYWILWLKDGRVDNAHVDDAIDLLLNVVA